MLKRIFKNSFYTLCSRSLLTLTNLCIIFAVSKFLKPAELGIYAITFFFYYLASILSSYGLKLYLGKETAYRRDDIEFKRIVLVEVLNSLIVGFMLSVLITVLTLLFYNNIEFSLLIPVMISGLLFGVERNLLGILLGEERMDIETLYQFINLVIVGGLTILTVKKIGIPGIYFLRMGASLVLIYLRSLSLITRGYQIKTKSVMKNFIKREKNFFFASELLYFILRQVDVFILSFLITKELLGNYFLALRIYLAFALFAEIMSSSFTPFISRTYRGKEKKSLYAFNQTVLKYFLVGGLIFSTSLMLLRNPISSLFSTDYITTTGHFLMFFSIMLFFRILYYYPGNVLTATEYQNKRFYIVLSASIIMILLNILLGSLFSVYGIISSRAVVEIFMLTAFWITMKKIIKKPTMKKPKILFVAPFPPPYHGASMQSELIKKSQMLNQNYNLKVIPLQFAKEIKDIGKFSLLKILKMIIFSFRIFISLFNFKPELVYYTITHIGYSFYRDFFFISIIKLFRTRIIYHHHTKGASEATKSKKFLQKWIYKDTFSIVLSPLLVYDIKHLVPEKKIFIVPNGVPEIEINIKKKKNSIPTILFLSNMIIEKGVFVLLDAFFILKKRGCLFNGIYAGNWSYNINKNDFIKKVYEYDLKAFIQIKGGVYGEKKISLFNKSDIFAFPTFLKHETFGNVLLEAMRSSLPVVTSNEASIPYIVENEITGFICKKRDPYDLADKLEQLIKDKKLRLQMGKKGRERYLTHFTFKRFEENFSQVLQKTLLSEITK